MRWIRQIVPKSVISLKGLSFSASTALRPDVFRTFFRQPRANHLLWKLFFVKNGNCSRMGSTRIARAPFCRGSTQNFAAILMEATISFFEDTIP